MEKIKELSRKLNSSMDNLFGLLSYAMIRNLADSVANKALVPVIAQSPLNEKIGYNLVKDSIQLNEFGTIAVDLILKEYIYQLNLILFHQYFHLILHFLYSLK